MGWDMGRDNHLAQMIFGNVREVRNAYELMETMKELETLDNKFATIFDHEAFIQTHEKFAQFVADEVRERRITRTEARINRDLFFQWWDANKVTASDIVTQHADRTLKEARKPPLEQVFLFTATDANDLEREINDWLRQNVDRVRVVDRQLQYSTVQDESFIRTNYVVMLTYHTDR